ncbi:hypothetical protein C8R45DRAFT_991980 [Mycena sanguinolenta]|nr:hypothetical protein C8R45DRAFT_991980 [Mycena sanguinolenta]
MREELAGAAILFFFCPRPRTNCTLPWPRFCQRHPQQCRPSSRALLSLARYIEPNPPGQIAAISRQRSCRLKEHASRLEFRTLQIFARGASPSCTILPIGLPERMVRFWIKFVYFPLIQGLPHISNIPRSTIPLLGVPPVPPLHRGHLAR